MLSWLLVAGNVQVAATPVCPDEPRTACGGRIFPEAENTTAFVQHDMGEYADGIAALERDFPRFVKVRSFSEFLGRDAVSAGGRDMWLIEITDFDVPERGKKPVVVSLSVHGPERAGLEGGVRYAEDLARWASEDRDHVLRNGTDKDSIQVPILEALGKVHLYLADANPDGWSNGDVQNGGVFMRGNANGVDLNREFPTVGWTRPAYTPLSEPESIAWRDVVTKIDPIVTGDLHGELTSAQDSFADIMLPAGQWDPVKQAREEALARHMKSNVDRYFDEQGVSAGAASGAAGMKPAEYATGFDVVGYDASGFMGDWFNQSFDAIDMDVEHFFSHMAPNSTWAAPLEDAHIAAVRAEIETFMVESIVTNKVRVKLKIGRVGYVNDPRVITDDDGYGGPKPLKGYVPVPYRSTRMTYFKDLSRVATTPVRRVPARGITRGRLHGLDSLVIADKIRSSKTMKKRSTVRALKRWVKRGGNLVLTDAALKLLPRLGIVGKKAIGKQLLGAGHLDIDNFNDPYLTGVHETASQTYYEVGLGYSVDEDSSPHWTVKKGRWKKAKGKAIAHIDDDTRVGLGRLRYGRGTIAVIGALLPPATEKFDHYYGLADYAVSVAGGQILNNILRYGAKH
jgi:hypothetical protein